MKRLGVNPEDSSNVSTTSSNSELSKETEIDSTSVKTEITAGTDTDQSNIWKEKPMEDEEKTREREFEEYLEDLFM